MSSNESAAYKIMTDLNVDYVLVNISLNFIYLSLTLCRNKLGCFQRHAL